MNQYDSILKEKKIKKTEINEPTSRKKFPTFTLSLIATITIILISYIVYYNTILSKEKILINNISILKEQYQTIIENLYLDNFSKANIEGSIILNETNKYAFKKDNNNYYLNGPTLNKYIDNSFSSNFNLNLKYLSTLNKDKYIKTFYIKNKIPTVETNIVLSKVDLEELLGIMFLNDYEAIITCENNAITNEIINIKIIINDKITWERKVINFHNNTIYYKDSNNDLHFDILLKNNDFTIKIYKNDILHSVINGIEKVNTYNYSYQIIDKLYTLNLITRTESDKYIYEFSSSINSVKSTLTLSLSDISSNLFELVNYQDLSVEEQEIYKRDKNILLDFINKHKNDI